MSHFSRFGCFKLMVFGVVGAAIPALLSSQSGGRSASPDPVRQVQTADMTERARDALGLSGGEVVAITPTHEPGGIVHVNLTLANQPCTLQLSPHSDRGPGFRVLAQGADGELRPADPGPVCTLRGFVVDAPGSGVTGAVLEDGLHAMIRMNDGAAWWIQPLKPVIADAGDLHVVYQSEDVVPSGKRCGMPDQLMAKQIDPVPPQGAGAPNGPGGPCIALLACDADREFFQSYGSIANVVARISLIMNTVNFQYENEVGITHQLGTMIVRTAEPDPYTASASSDLVCQMVTYWLANHSNVERDVVQLFTGRTIDGGTIGQAADIGDICNDNQGCCNCGTFGSDGSYCYVWSNFSGPGTPFAESTTLSAHELGHLWNAHHCPCVEPPFTMNPFIVASSQHHPVASIPPIMVYRDTRPCLEPCAGGNVNDECVNAIPIFEGATPFDTLGATTDGLAHSGTCQYDGQTYNDVWYTFVPTCTTEHTISVCGSGYDTDIVIYEGSECTPTTDRVVGCNDDGCTGETSLQSIMTVLLHEGQTYLLRLGGWQSPDYGAGTVSIAANATLDSDKDGQTNCLDNCPLHANPNQEDCDNDGVGDVCSGEPDCNRNAIPDSCDITSGFSLDVNKNGVPDECDPVPTCRADVAPAGTPDGVVSVPDLLFIINNWGPCPNPNDCPADVAPDGPPIGDDVVSTLDLLYIINNWGPCP